jgi:diguanylate cyclase (GGDEF)-like protein
MPMDLSNSAGIHFQAKQVDLLYGHALTDSGLGMIAVVLAAGAAYTVAPVAILGIWIAIGLALYTVRIVLATTYRNRAPSNPALTSWLRYFVLGAVFTGIVWGAFGGYVAQSSDLLRAGFVLFVTSAVALISAVTCAGSLPATCGFSFCALLPPAALLATRADAFGYTVATMLLLTLALTLAGSLAMKRLLWDSIGLQSEIEQLTGHLDQRRTQIEKLNVALKTNQDKREQAEQNLRRTAADLGLVQGKAKALADTLEHVSPVCQVTALANRRALDQHVEAEWRRATRDKRPVSVVVVGLDEYDEYLAGHGRQSTDVLLKKIALTVKGFGRRAGDMAGRYDDSRMGLLLHNCDSRNALRIAEALRKRIEAHKIPHAGSKNRDILTIHVGVATMMPARSLQVKEIFKRVETALYEAQFQGGNKVVIYKPLSKIRLERWDTQAEGQLNEQAMMQKLLVWGYETEKTILPAGTSLPDQVSEDELVVSILTGELKITIEGHSMIIQPGDCIFVPPSMAMHLDVVGDQPVVKFTATRTT